MAWTTTDWIWLAAGLIAAGLIIWFLIWFIAFRKRKKRTSEDAEKEIQELTEKQKVFKDFEIAERTRAANPDMSPQEILWKLARPHFMDLRNNPNVLDLENEKEVYDNVRQRPIPINTSRDRGFSEEEQRTGKPELPELPERRDNIQSNTSSRDSNNQIRNRKVSRNIFKRR